MIGDAGQNIRKIGFRIEAVQLGRLDDGIEYSSPLAAGIGAGEEIGAMTVLGGRPVRSHIEL